MKQLKLPSQPKVMVPALLILLAERNGEVQAGDAFYDTMADRIGLTAGQRTLKSQNGELLYKKSFQFARAVAKSKGWIADSPRGLWRLSPSGWREARRLKETPRQPNPRRRLPKDARVKTISILPELLDTLFEGEEAYVQHRARERNPEVVTRAKAAWRAQGDLTCDVCGFDFQATYGVEYIECHHTHPVSQMPKEGGLVDLSTLAKVCANCHRMLHQGHPWPSIAALKDQLARRQPTGRLLSAPKRPSRPKTSGSRSSTGPKR
jgi:hypothetical protein